MLAQRTSVFTEGARKNEAQEIHHDESNQDESCDKEDGRRNQVRSRND